MEMEAIPHMTLKDYIIKKDVSQAEIARRAGVRQSYFNRILNGIDSMPMKQVNNIARALNITPEQLMKLYHYKKRRITVKRKKVIRGDLPCGRFSSEWLTECRCADNCASANKCPIAKYNCGHRQGSTNVNISKINQALSL